MKNKRFKMAVVVVVVIGMILGSYIGITTFVSPSHQSNNKLSINTDSTAKPQSSSSKLTDSVSINGDSDIDKEETVYVLADSAGSIKKIIVSDWLKNPTNAERLKDYSELNDVENVKGNETYSINPDNMMIWNAAGKDIYYQGTFEKALPVDVSISYMLDGKPITAEKLAGQSGKVTITFNYKNNQKQNVEIDGKQEPLYVPFVMLTGTLLDNDNFSNIEISNGKIINDGNKTVVIGFAFPGIQENLDISSETLSIPNSVQITADVSDFSLSTTMTVATNSIFNHVDLKGVDTIDELTSSLSELSNASTELVNGSSKLYDGISTLLSKSNELISAIQQLSTGAKTLYGYTIKLYTGATAFKSGMDDLSGGLKTLSDKNEQLIGGAEQVFTSLLSEADKQLSAAGLTVPKLTINNYSTVLNGILATLDKDTVYQQAYNTALTNVTKQVNANEPLIRQQVEAGVKSDLTAKALISFGQTMSVEEYAAAVAANTVDTTLKAQVTSAVEAGMAKPEVTVTINANTASAIQDQIAQGMKSKDVTDGINAAVSAAQNGAGSISALKSQLDSYNSFYSGLTDYTNGVADAYNGSAKLDSLIGTLELGAKEINDGGRQLSEGLEALKNGSASLIDGVKHLQDGSMQLSDGMKQFNEQGIQKLVDAMDGDVGKLITRLRATIDVSRSYTSFSGISPQMSGSVKFIYKTDSVDAE